MVLVGVHQVLVQQAYNNMENNTVKVKDLPRLEEILPGNLLIVEDEVGTKALDFKDFVVGPANTSFYNGLATNINNLSTYSLSLCNTVANNINETVGAVRTEVFAITSNLTQRFPQYFVYQIEVDIPNGRNVVAFDIFAPFTTLRASDIYFVRTTNTTTSAASLFITLNDPVLVSPIGQPELYQYVCTLSTVPTFDNTTQFFDVKVQKFY